MSVGGFGKTAGQRPVKLLFLEAPSAWPDKHLRYVSAQEHIVAFDNNCANDKQQNPGNGSECAALHHGP